MAAPRNPFANLDAQAGAAYGVRPQLLSSIGRRESGNRVVAVNTWDSNAKRGTPSIGRMQMIEPTFNAYARHARDANPAAWQGVPLDWHNPQAQTLATAWAVKNGHGGAWSTFGAALKDAGGADGPTGMHAPAGPAPIAPTPGGESGQQAAAVDTLFADKPLLATALHAKFAATPGTTPLTAPAAPLAPVAGGADLVGAARQHIGETLAQAAASIKKTGASFDSAWCGDFVESVFRARGLKPPPARYVPALLKWAQAGKHVTNAPARNSLALFDWNHDGTPDHVGIVEGVGRDGVHTIEGNTSTPGGRGVAAKTRSRRDILAFVNA